VGTGVRLDARRPITVRRTIMATWDLQENPSSGGFGEGGDSDEGLSNQPAADDDDSDND